MIEPNCTTGQSREKREEDIRRNNLEWAKAIDKWGGLDYYLTYSNLPELVEEKFNTKIVEQTLRHEIRLKDGQIKTFGVTVASKEYVFLTKTDYRLRRQEINELCEEISIFWEHFPRYRNKKLVGVLACVYCDEPDISYAEQNGFLVVGVGFEPLEIKNRADFEPKVWVHNA
jgi:hypothetical protein